MNIEQRKNELLDLLRVVQAKTEAKLPDSPALKELLQLAEDIRNDYYTVVVVGEFKHGKTTFINALLGESLMPVDVTPTTAAIHVLFYGEERRLEIVKTNGEREVRPLSDDTLQDYTASQPFDPDEINYLKCILPSKLLTNKVVIVDTPGVNDLNEHRSQITHHFVPRADAVIFMLNMNTPIKKTEQTFLQETLLKRGLDRIVYAANFMDRVDEDEIETIQEFIKRRLEHFTGQKDPKVFPISAEEALEAKLGGDEERYELSGVKDLEEHITTMIHSGSRSSEKLERYRIRASFILEQLIQEAETVIDLTRESLEDLQSALQQLQAWFNDGQQREQQLEDYIHDREGEIFYLIRKSISYFSDRLKEELADRIRQYQGTDIKVFVESQLSFSIKSRVNHWMDEYGEYIQHLLVKLEGEIARGLSSAFQKNVSVMSHQKRSFRHSFESGIEVANTKNTTVQAGLWIGGASAFAMALGGGFLVPIIGMEGLPFFSKQLAENQLNKIKPELLIQMDQYVTNLTEKMYADIENIVMKTIDDIAEKTLAAFHAEINHVGQMIEKQMHDRKVDSASVEGKVRELEEFIQFLKIEIERGNKDERLLLKS